MQFAMFNAPLMIRAVDLLSDDPSFYQLIEQNPGKRSYREVIFLFFLQLPHAEHEEQLFS